MVVVEVTAWVDYKVEMHPQIRNSEYLQKVKNKKEKKQTGMNFRPNHRDMFTRNHYLFEHQVIFVLFFVQKPR